MIVGWIWGYGAYALVWKSQLKEYKQKIKKAELIAQEIITKAEHKQQNAERDSKALLQDAQQQIDKRNQKIDQIEQRLLTKEEKIDQKYETLEKEKTALLSKTQQLEALIASEREKLSEIAQLTPEEAKKDLYSMIESEQKTDINTFIEKFKQIKEEEAEKESINIITKVLPRISMNSVSEFTITQLDLPSEDIKGKLIGREGRNVSYIEKITWVEVIIDDTPLVVKLSSYDSEKRFLAAEALKLLIKDWRINPFYIEKTYQEVVNGFDDLLIEKGKEALQILNLPITKPDIMKMIGQFHLRYSYGQNLWIHSIEVARISEAIAVEIWADGLMAKKAWLLHDIGKVIAANGQSHTKIWADVLRKYWFDPIIVHAAESHHFDIPITHPIARIVTAADAISAWRPWARFNTKALFVEKMSELEKLISSVSGVDKVHVMQAWREIMIFVNPSEVDDLGVQKLIKEVAIKVEDQLDYPGIIRVVAIRETKVIDYLR